MTEKSSPDDLRILEELVSERRASKGSVETEYRQIDETLSSIEDQLDPVREEYQPLGSNFRSIASPAR